MYGSTVGREPRACSSTVCRPTSATPVACAGRGWMFIRLKCSVMVSRSPFSGRLDCSHSPYRTDVTSHRAGSIPRSASSFTSDGSGLPVSHAYATTYPSTAVS